MTARELARLRRAALDAAFDALAGEGFRRRMRWLATIDLAEPERLEGQLSLADRARAHWGTVEFAPYVSVRDPEVEEIVARLWPQARDDPHAATLTVHLGYLMPQRRWEVFGLVHDGGVDPRAVDRLAAAVREYALPFLRRNSTRRALLQAFAAQPDVNRDAFQLPVLLALVGKRRQAVRIVRKALRAQPDFPGYREFAAAFDDFLFRGD